MYMYKHLVAKTNYLLPKALQVFFHIRKCICNFHDLFAWPFLLLTFAGLRFFCIPELPLARNWLGPGFPDEGNSLQILFQQ